MKCGAQKRWGILLIAFALLLIGFATWKTYVVVQPVLQSGWGKIIVRAYSPAINIQEALTGKRKKHEAAWLRAQVRQRLLPYLASKLKMPIVALAGGILLGVGGLLLFRYEPRYCVEWGRVANDYRCSKW